MKPNIDVFYSFNDKDYIEVKEHDKKVKELEKEIERLKESEEYHRKGFVELHKRIEETIEYLEAVNKSNQKIFVLVNKQDLLDILKREDK